MQRKFELTQVDGPCGTKLLLKKHTCNKAIHDRITLSVTIALLILFARVRAPDMSDLFASIVATYQAVGSLFRPLRSPDDVQLSLIWRLAFPKTCPTMMSGFMRGCSKQVPNTRVARGRWGSFESECNSGHFFNESSKDFR